MRTLSRAITPRQFARSLAGLVLMLLGLVLGALPAVAATAAEPAGTNAPPSADAGYVSVVTVNGLIDPIVAELMNQSIADADRGGAKALVFQADLDGSVIPNEDLHGLLGHIKDSPVPIYLWVGSSGSRLTGSATLLVGVVDGVSMAPGTSIGDARSLLIATTDGTLRDFSPLQDPKFAALRSGLLDAQQAKDAGIITTDAPVLGDLFITLPGVQTRTTQDKSGVTHREPVTLAVFSQLSLLKSFFHTAASPAVAYLLFTVGLSLLIFELFTAGVGVAGVIGAGAFVLSCFGLASLPTRWWGIALILLSMVALAVDVQTGIPRFWTGTGLVLYTVGSFTLYDGVSMSWITIVVGIGGVALAFLAGMPSMVRTRFSTPTIGREWMVGEIGRAASDISPDGVVQIKGAPWRAYTNRATPIEALDAVRVVGIEGLVLEVEPVEGGARDYRDRRPKSERGETANASTVDAPLADNHR